MITLNDLTELYNSDYFRQSNQSCILKEKQDNKSALSEVNVTSSGSGVFIRPEFLRDCEKIFKKINNDLSFRDINDGTFILEKNNQQFIIYVEMKSGYSAVKKKAIKQIPVSSIKIKSLLRNLQSFSSLNYKEVGIIISYPPSQDDKYDNKNNAMVFDHKSSYINSQMGCENIIDKELRVNRKVLLEAKHFPNLPQGKLHNDIKFNNMMVYHCPVNKNAETIDLDKLI